MTKQTESILTKLRKVYYDIGQDMGYFKYALEYVRQLVEQGHDAEFIAYYLVIHCGVYARHEDIKSALIKHKIAT